MDYLKEAKEYLEAASAVSMGQEINEDLLYNLAGINAALIALVEELRQLRTMQQRGHWILTDVRRPGKGEER